MEKVEVQARCGDFDVFADYGENRAVCIVGPYVVDLAFAEAETGQNRRRNADGLADDVVAAHRLEREYFDAAYDILPDFFGIETPEHPGHQGTGIQLAVGFEREGIENKEVERALLETARRAEDLRPLMKNIAGIMADSTEENFKEEGRPDKWQELAKATIKHCKKRSLSNYSRWY